MNDTSSGPNSHTVREFCLLLQYMRCLLPSLYLKHYSLIFVTLCLKLNFAWIIYVVIHVTWQYHLSKTLAIFCTMIILSSSWWITSIWWEYSILTSFEEKFLQICCIIQLWCHCWSRAINNHKEKMRNGGLFSCFVWKIY